MTKPRSEKLKKEAERAAYKMKVTPESAKEGRVFIYDKPGDYTEQDYEPEEVMPYTDTTPDVLKKEFRNRLRYEGVDANPASPGILGRIGPVDLKAGVDINPKHPKKSVLGVKGRMAF